MKSDCQTTYTVKQAYNNARLSNVVRCAYKGSKVAQDVRRTNHGTSFMEAVVIELGVDKREASVGVLCSVLSRQGDVFIHDDERLHDRYSVGGNAAVQEELRDLTSAQHGRILGGGVTI